LPRASTTVALGGTGVVARGPTRVMRAPSMTTTASTMGAPPAPITVPPDTAVTSWAVAGTVAHAARHAMSPARNVFIDSLLFHAQQHAPCASRVSGQVLISDVVNSLLAGLRGTD